MPSSLAALPLIPLVLAVVITAMQIGAIAFLFRRDARDWLTNKGQFDDGVTSFE